MNGKYQLVSNIAAKKPSSVLAKIARFFQGQKNPLKPGVKQARIDALKFEPYPQIIKRPPSKNLRKPGFKEKMRNLAGTAFKDPDLK